MCSVQAFLPAVTLRQQAFKSLQEQTGAAKQLHVPAAWHVGVSNAVSLAVGAGKVLCSVLLAAVAAAGSRMLDSIDGSICQNTGPSDLAEATFSLPVLQGQKELHECCFGDSALELAQNLTAAVESGLNVRAPASMQQVRCLSYSLFLHLVKAVVLCQSIDTCHCCFHHSCWDITAASTIPEPVLHVCRFTQCPATAMLRSCTVKWLCQEHLCC